MADEPHKLATRPLSPFLTIFRWPVTMATSIVHRMTGVALAGGMLVVAWWLVSAASGPETYQSFVALITTPLGQLVLIGFAWSLAYHTLNGIRHLGWDLGYGFAVRTAGKTGVLVILLSFIVAAAVFAVAWSGHGGYYQ